MTVAGVGKLGDATCMEDGKIKQSYRRWNSMLHRCYNPNTEQYGYYGVRGITVCERWLTFANYEQDIQELEGYDDPEATTIDRINNDGNYTPSNCRWATPRVQVINRRPNKEQRYFVAYPPGFDGNGAGIISNNQSEIARQHDLDFSHINKCLKGKRSSHKGWRFEYIEECE